jgi:predicted AAA+ superfamily ATPase
MTAMTIKTFSEVAPRLPRSTSILLRGDHGIGKSQVVRQVAAVLDGGLPVIDRRLSQMSEGDMIGLPSTDGEVTRFNPPDWFKRACDEPVCLFLDELNRATTEVMQAAFQIVLDRELNGWKLHPQTAVFAAVNSSASYTVNEIDPALLDRFWTIDLTPSANDWLVWARGKLADVVVDFIAQNEKFLDPPRNAEPGSVQVSRRSWERLSNALCLNNLDNNPEDAAFYPVCLGYVGLEATTAFQSFAKSQDARFTGEDIVNSYTTTIQKKLKKLNSQDKWNTAVDKTGDYVTTKLDTLTDAQAANIRAFAQDLPAELRVSLWSKLTNKGVDKLDLAKAVHKAMCDLLLEVFNAKKDDVSEQKPKKGKKQA